MFWFFLVFSVFFAVVWAFIDNIRRRDRGGWGKAGWALLILVIPLIGTPIYMGRGRATRSIRSELAGATERFTPTG